MAKIDEKNFVVKFQTPQGYSLGSSDTYLGVIEELISNTIRGSLYNNLNGNGEMGAFQESEEFLRTAKESCYSDDELEEEIKRETKVIVNSMSYNERAAIVDSKGDFVGIIGLYGANYKENSGSVRIVLNKEISEEDYNGIVSTFVNWLVSSLNIRNIVHMETSVPGKIDLLRNPYLETEDYTREQIDAALATLSTEERALIERLYGPVGKKDTYPSIVIPSARSLIVPVDSVDRLKEMSGDYGLINLDFLKNPYFVQDGGEILAILGVRNRSYQNKRAKLSFYMPEEFDSAKTARGVNEYIDEMRRIDGLHSITIEFPAWNCPNTLVMQNSERFNFAGTIPYGAYCGEKGNSHLRLFQSYPGMEHMGFDWDDMLTDEYSGDVPFNKDDLADCIPFGDGYALCSPKYLKDNGFNMNMIIAGHTTAFQNREQFTIPLGYDKFIPQWGVPTAYGLSKSLLGYPYIIVDMNNMDDMYVGFINIKPSDVDRCAEIEFGVTPFRQKKGIGSGALETLYKELERVGYLSIVSHVFGFNEGSIALHEKSSANFVGEINDYYFAGDEYNKMLIYVKNPDNSCRSIMGR